MNHRQVGALVLLAALVCPLAAGCGDQSGEEETQGGAPAQYQFGEVSVAALTPEEGVQVSEEKETTYLYGGLADSGGAVASYVAQLTAPETAAQDGGEDAEEDGAAFTSGGFSVVGEDLVETDAPDFSTEEGSVRLAKNAAEEGRVLSIQMVWTQGSCSVTVAETDGTVQPAPKQETQRKSEGMNLTQALEYFKGLTPSDLGLSGASMDNYNVYALDGVIIVDEQPCICLNVYSSEDPPHTNQIAGSYLMTSDGTHLYRLNESNGTVEEIQGIAR